MTMFFDRRDHELIQTVNDVIENRNANAHLRKTYYPVFHPNGIKEMAESKGLRTAYAVAYLLNSLEIGDVEDRLAALRMLRSEIIDTANDPMPRNTARVLLQIMKTLVRAHGQPQRQLELAHDFRSVASGKPRLIRRFLARYHLLEMPEEWNQIAFDYHVHDVHTKGRKTPTHLLMDAWIKGIRRIRVIYYNHVEARIAAELSTAAQILGIELRIGVEFNVPFRNRYVQLIWVPRGLLDTPDFLCFLAEPKVIALMEAGRAVSAYKERQVMALLANYNERHRHALDKAYGVTLPPISEAAFNGFVGVGEKSVLHLTGMIRSALIEAIHRRPSSAAPDAAAAPYPDLDEAVRHYLSPEENPDLPNHNVPSGAPDMPELMTLRPEILLRRLAKLHSGYRVTLGLTNLSAADVLEIIYGCHGMISRLELFNLKDYAARQMPHAQEINRLQQAINSGSLIRLKRVVLDIIKTVEESDAPDREDRLSQLNTILHDLPSLNQYYRDNFLKARIGSDSTGRTRKGHGMGLAIIDTLPHRARRLVKRGDVRHDFEELPIHMGAYRTRTFRPRTNSRPAHPLVRFLVKAIPGLGILACQRMDHWEVLPAETKLSPNGNIVTLGGMHVSFENGGTSSAGGNDPPPESRWHYVNTRLKNTVKVVAGFLPAFFTFLLTKDWWVLAWGGAFIWFAITGIRNILQAVLGGGGWHRSSLMRWNDYVSWSRITDSLLFSGLSVPLLDYLVKTVILDRGFNITTSNHSVLLYTFMALVNGVYLSSHNIFRGLPRGAVYANFFRSVLSIPIAIGLNAGIGAIMAVTGAPHIDATLQKWAAIISKLASDSVAGIIEGIADRHTNIHSRLRDYGTTFREILDVYARLEILYPETRPLQVLETIPAAGDRRRAEATELERNLIIHALDMLYFWYYKPRARSAFRHFLRQLHEDERSILLSSQATLLRHRDVSQMFIDGAIGRSFPRPLAFYLSRNGSYLDAVKRLSL